MVVVIIIILWLHWQVVKVPLPFFFPTHTLQIAPRSNEWKTRQDVFPSSFHLKTFKKGVCWWCGSSALLIPLVSFLLSENDCMSAHGQHLPFPLFSFCISFLSPHHSPLISLSLAYQQIKSFPLVYLFAHLAMLIVGLYTPLSLPASF